MCFATAAQTIFPTYPILQKMAQTISSAVVLETLFGDAIQGQQAAQRRGSGSLVPSDLAPQQPFRLGPSAVLGPFNCQQGLFGCVRLTSFVLCSFKFCVKKC